jgi:hypothetical protein
VALPAAEARQVPDIATTSSPGMAARIMVVGIMAARGKAERGMVERGHRITAGFVGRRAAIFSHDLPVVVPRSDFPARRSVRVTPTGRAIMPTHQKEPSGFMASTR